eukprot:m.82979 g.82979  ORF g.82979 m.82979 type:complete len:1034 (+) comp36317_c0_seq1:320-3421(+)
MAAQNGSVVGSNDARNVDGDPFLLSDVGITADERAFLLSRGESSGSWRGARILLRSTAPSLNDAVDGPDGRFPREQAVLAAYGDRMAYLTSLRHPNCVPFYGACFCEGFDRVLFAFYNDSAAAVTVASRLRQDTAVPFTYREIVDVAGDVLAGLRYLAGRAHPLTRTGCAAVTSEGVILTAGGARLADVTAGVFPPAVAAASSGLRGDHFVTFSATSLVLEMCTTVPLTGQYDLDRYNACLHSLGVSHPMYAILKRSMEPPPNCPTPAELAQFLEDERRSHMYASSPQGSEMAVKMAHLNVVVEECGLAIARLQKNVAQLQHALFKVVTEHTKSTSRFGKQIRALGKQNRQLRDHLRMQQGKGDWSAGASPLVQHQLSSLDSYSREDVAGSSSGDDIMLPDDRIGVPTRGEDDAGGKADNEADGSHRLIGAVSTESMVAEVAEGDISALLSAVESVTGSGGGGGLSAEANLDEIVAGLQQFGASSSPALSSGDDESDDGGDRTRRASSMPSPEHPERRFNGRPPVEPRRHSDACRPFSGRPQYTSPLVTTEELLPAPEVPIRTSSLRSLNTVSERMPLVRMATVAAATAAMTMPLPLGDNRSTPMRNDRGTPSSSSSSSSSFSRRTASMAITTTTTTTTATSGDSPTPNGSFRGPPDSNQSGLQQQQEAGDRNAEIAVVARRQRSQRKRRPHSMHEVTSHFSPPPPGAVALALMEAQAVAMEASDEATPSEVAGFVPHDRPLTAAVARAFTSAESSPRRKVIPRADSPTGNDTVPPMEEAPPPYQFVMEERRQEAAARRGQRVSASPPGCPLAIPDRNTRTSLNRLGNRRQQLLTRAARSLGTFPSTVWSRTFRFSKTFDKNGIVYYLGTGDMSHSWRNPGETGIILVTRSGNQAQARGRTVDALNRKKGTTCSTRNEPLSHFCFDFGPNRSLLPDHYSLRHGAAGKWSALRSWNLEGSVDGIDWIVLRRHRDDVNLKSKYATASWPIELPNPPPPPLRYLRIVQTGPNSTGGFHLCVGGFEVYGTLYEENVF